MALVDTKAKRQTDREFRSAKPATAMPALRRRRFRIIPPLISLAVVVAAAMLGWAMWNACMGAPWTRDGTVRVYVVTMAPEVEGRIVKLPVKDNQFVHKGDLLMIIDPTNYRIAVSLGEAAVQQTRANAENAEREAKRREELTDLSVTTEQKQTYATAAVVAYAQYQQAVANLDQARVNLQRTEIRSLVNGWVTNLLTQLGDYAKVGQNEISVVDADSFWVDGYFEETNLAPIRVGDPASIKLMGYRQILRGHVGSIARGINVPNAQPNGEGLAQVNPIFTWVRLAQRIPVRVHLDEVPDGVVFSAGMTATVQIDLQLPANCPDADAASRSSSGATEAHPTATGAAENATSRRSAISKTVSDAWGLVSSILDSNCRD
jgi:multidrug resistance efflux pump